MGIGEWIAVGTVILAAGGLLAKVAGLDARINKLESGQADQGRRIGEAHATIEAIKQVREVERHYERRATGANPTGSKGG
jgi:hypothetical protein